MQRRLSFLTLALALTTLLICNVCGAQTSAPQSPIGAKLVLWIGSDGFGSHYVNWEELPNLKAMRDNGAWTLHMRTVLPSASALNWESQLTGVPSEMHGYRTWGSREPDLPPIYLNEHGRFPDIYRVLKDNIPGFTGTVVYSWEGIGYLYDKEAVDDAVYITGDNIEEVYQTGVKQLATKPTFAWIYFSQPDHVGHAIGWGTPEYQQMMSTIDSYVGKIRDYLQEQGLLEDTVMIFTADHGGSEKGHGDARLDHMEAPFIMCGKGVKPGEIEEVFVCFDVAPTIAWIYGVPAPLQWRGRAPLKHFDIPQK